jgi:hypothetical protein
MIRCCLVLVFVTACASAPAAKNPTPSSSTPGNAKSAALASLGELTKAANAYSMAVGHCPQSIDDLVHPPTGSPFIASVPKDPWGHDIAIMPATKENPTSAFVSAGPDGELLTDDDVSLPIQCDAR